MAGKTSSDYEKGSFFERIKTAWKEEEAERAKKIAEQKHNKEASDEVAKNGQKRKRGDKKEIKKDKKKVDEELDEATLLRKELIRRYPKNALPRNSTGKMVVTIYPSHPYMKN